MKGLPLLFATALLLALASADDRLRDVQGVLKTQGFYYGEITGTEGTETGAAIRRFQIRNGIPVTGKLNAATLAALGLEKKKNAAPAPQPAPALAVPAPAQKQINPPVPAQKNAGKPAAPAEALPPLKKDGAPLPGGEAPGTVQKPTRHVKPSDIAVVEPPAPIPAPVSTPYTTMFRDSPYANAPRDVQAGIIHRAQALMAARRFYRGPLDGVAGPATSEAIFAFQQEAELRRTGRLDPDTLAEMKLLPQPAQGNPLLKPFYNPNRRRDRSVSSE